MCGNPFKIIKNIFSPPKPRSPQVVVQGGGPDPATMQELRRQRDQLDKQRDEFMTQQRQFNADQRKFLKEAQQRQVAPAIAPVVEKRQAAPATASETERSIKSRRRGRGSLRIPAAVNSGSAGTGLNVPRG